MPKLEISPLWAWSMFFVAALFYGFEFLLRVSPSVIVPYLMQTYAINAKQVGILSAYYYYTYTPLQLIAGTMVDHYGPRMLLTLSLLSCVIGIYLFGVIGSLPLAKLGRALIGFGSAFAFVGTLRICSDWLPKNMFATLAGITTTIGMVGAISGEVVLEALGSMIGIPNTFIFYITIGIILTIATYLVVRSKESFCPKETGLKEIQSLCKHVMFLMKKPIFWHISAMGLFIFMPTTIFGSLWSVKFISDVYQLQNAASYGSMIFLGWAVGSPLVGIATKYKLISAKNLLIFGSLCAGIITYFIIYQAAITASYLRIALFLFGFFSSAEVLVFDLNHIISGPALCGTAVALTNMVIMLGGFAQPIVGLLLDHNHLNTIHTYSYVEYKIALSILPISFLLCFILSIFFNEAKVTPPKTIPD